MRLYQYRLVILSAALLSFASVAGEPPKSAKAPDQQQLTKLLSGNTMDGEWAGRPYRQFFSTSDPPRHSGPLAGIYKTLIAKNPVVLTY